EGKSETLSVGPTLGYAQSDYSYGGGASLSRNEGETDESLLDINGDGLLDAVSLAGGGVRVRFNVGGRFTQGYVWTGGVGKGISENSTSSQGGGGYFTFGIGPI